MSMCASIKRLDHRLVGVGLLAFVVDDAFAGEARRLLGKGAVFVDGVGDCGIDAALFELRLIRDPNVEIFAAVARRSVHKARAIVIGDMFAGE